MSLHGESSHVTSCTIHSESESAKTSKDLRALLLIYLYMTSTKDNTQQPAVKKGPVIQMTMAKSTNGQRNDRGERVLP